MHTDLLEITAEEVLAARPGHGRKVPPGASPLGYPRAGARREPAAPC
jgi:hypothetical protein